MAINRQVGVYVGKDPEGEKRPICPYSSRPRSVLGRRQLCGVKLSVALFDAASAFVPSNRRADVVWASALATPVG